MHVCTARDERKRLDTSPGAMGGGGADAAQRQACATFLFRSAAQVAARSPGC
jgi:hypothetical protein